MVFFAANAVNPSSVAGGPQSYQNPYFTTSCGCGSGLNQVTMVPPVGAGNGRREGFQVQENMQHQGMQHQGMQQQMLPPQMGAGGGAAPMCTLTATAPPSGCCHPAPLHCEDCSTSYFKASVAYGS